MKSRAPLASMRIDPSGRIWNGSTMECRKTFLASGESGTNVTRVPSSITETSVIEELDLVQETGTPLSEAGEDGDEIADCKAIPIAIPAIRPVLSAWGGDRNIGPPPTSIALLVFVGGSGGGDLGRLRRTSNSKMSSDPMLKMMAAPIRPVGVNMVSVSLLRVFWVAVTLPAHDPEAVVSSLAVTEPGLKRRLQLLHLFGCSSDVAGEPTGFEFQIRSH